MLAELGIAALSSLARRSVVESHGDWWNLRTSKLDSLFDKAHVLPSPPDMEKPPPHRWQSLRKRDNKKYWRLR